jgi:glutamate-1-semialdehyde 2,1-aminomutase
LRSETERVGAILIFDEIKTSRCGPGGIQGELGIKPDITTLGKYIGGGMPSGAFGGRKDIMERYDPREPTGLRHAGTFNNNICSMMAGLAGLTRVFTADRAIEFLAINERYRCSLNEELSEKNVPMRFTGLGSMFTVHFTQGAVTTPRDIPAASRRMAQIFHMECLLNGILLASRGDVFISLPTSSSSTTDCVEFFDYLWMPMSPCCNAKSLLHRAPIDLNSQAAICPIRCPAGSLDDWRSQMSVH